VPRAEFTVSAEKETLLNLLVVVCPTHVGSPLRTRVIGPEPRTHFKPIVIAYLSTASTANGVEYRGTNEYRVCPAESHHLPVLVTYDSIAIYADSVTLIDDNLKFRASGHVVIEDGKSRTRVNQATIDFGAEDPIATLKIE
jgi:hypothetical protein